MLTVIDKDPKGRTQTVILWDSVSEPAKLAPTLKIGSADAVKYTTTGGHPDSERWFGAPTVKVLKERLEKGWPEGVERLQKLAVRSITPMSIRRRRVRGDQGDEVDMQAVWRGDLPRAWTRTRRMARAGTCRTLTICIQLGDSCGVDADKLFWRGASALRLTEALTEAGYNVGLYGSVIVQNADSGGKVDGGQFVEIKATDSPLDLSALAALTAMPGWFRTAGFAGIITNAALAGQSAAYALGQPAHHLTEEMAAKVGLTNMFIQPPVLNQQDAEKWIDDVMAKVETPELKAA